jgi:hypothetical protein
MPSTRSLLEAIKSFDKSTQMLRPSRMPKARRWTHIYLFL